MAEQNDAWDKMQVSIYKRKTGLSDTVISHMMADTTYMTGCEAAGKHFAVEVLENAVYLRSKNAYGTGQSYPGLHSHSHTLTDSQPFKWIQPITESGTHRFVVGSRVIHRRQATKDNNVMRHTIKAFNSFILFGGPSYKTADNLPQQCKIGEPKGY